MYRDDARVALYRVRAVKKRDIERKRRIFKRASEGTRNNGNGTRKRRLVDGAGVSLWRWSIVVPVGPRNSAKYADLRIQMVVL